MLLFNKTINSLNFNDKFLFQDKKMFSLNFLLTNFNDVFVL